MSKKVRELLEQRSNLVAQARKLLDEAEGRGGLSTDERAQYDKMFSDIQKLGEEIEREERQQELERQVALTSKPEYKNSENPEEQRKVAVSQAVNAYLTTGRVSSENRHYFGHVENRGYTVGSEPDGGYLVMPDEFFAELIRPENDQTFMRSFARIIRSGAQSICAPTRTAQASDAEWTQELTLAAQEAALKFGKRRIQPHPLTKLVRVSDDLIMADGMNAQQIIIDEINYIYSITEEKGYLTGNGSQQPLGLFTTSDHGISAARDVSTGNTTTAITFDGLKEARGAIKAQYRSSPSVRWLFHRDAVTKISKLKDGNGQYLWQPGTQMGQPDMLLGYPVSESEYVPNTFTTGKLVGLFGDLSKYWIMEHPSIAVKVLTELYAGSNEIGYITRRKIDGAPVIEEAFARVKLA